MTESNFEIAANLVGLYGFAVDTLQWDLFDQIFTDDVAADYGTGTWNDLKTWKKDFAAYHEPFDRTQHAMTSVIPKFLDNTARVITYGQWLLIRSAVPNGGNRWWGQGWYDDELVRLAEGWRIKSRKCRIITWWGNPEVSQTNSDVKLELTTTSLRREFSAGLLNFY